MLSENCKIENFVLVAIQIEKYTLVSSSASNSRIPAYL